jgi:hypothetical protein
VQKVAQDGEHEHQRLVVVLVAGVARERGHQQLLERVEGAGPAVHGRQAQRRGLGRRAQKRPRRNKSLFVRHQRVVDLDVRRRLLNALCRAPAEPAGA